jgi:hypothetical protein
MFGKKKRDFMNHIFDNIDYAKKNGRYGCSIYIAVTPPDVLSYAVGKLRNRGYICEVGNTDLKIYWSR